jgi:urocanate hydratase
MVGVARRSWARNTASIETCIEYNKEFKNSDHITLPFIANKDMIKDLVNEYYNKLS